MGGGIFPGIAVQAASAGRSVLHEPADGTRRVLGRVGKIVGQMKARLCADKGK